MQNELKEKKKEIARGNRELEDLRKSEKAQYDKHEAELKKVHADYERIDMEHHQSMAILRRLVEEQKEEIKFYKESCQKIEVLT